MTNESPYESTDQQTTQQQPYTQEFHRQSEQQPDQSQYPPQGYQPVYVQQPHNNAILYIVLSIVEILFWGGIFGVIPLIFSLLAYSAYNSGNIAEGQAKERNAKIALIAVAAGFALLFVAAFIFFLALGGIALFAASAS